mmetsp:Transcript_11027/g.32683  ORF Transcript_11027/g.32683 Transcript_11027/m.32683 type:complete len:100 (-) Transcript_11027:1095-1394(-)
MCAQAYYFSGMQDLVVRNSIYMKLNGLKSSDNFAVSSILPISFPMNETSQKSKTHGVFFRREQQRDVGKRSFRLRVTNFGLVPKTDLVRNDPIFRKLAR